MFEKKVSDLHMHLNGSFSMEFLEKIAKKNNSLNAYEELKILRQNNILNNKKNSNYSKAEIRDIWKQFSLIHQIIQNPEDIREGTIDVLTSSTASYLEIRTTPKKISNFSWEVYVDFFLAGLIEANRIFENKKIACGLLSLDRTIHSEQECYQIIDRVVFNKKKENGLLVGIDISGNPETPRTITGELLVKVLNYALENEIAVAIHIGESNSIMEKNDVDLILYNLKEWAKKQENNLMNPFHGRVRLGHGIYLDKKQQDIIRELQIPVEVCPSCHNRLNWWDASFSHPVFNIYNLWSDPITSGTDDSLIFCCDGKKENKSVLKMFGYSKPHYKEAREHQAKFRFLK